MNSSRTCSDQQSRERMKKKLDQDHLPDQQPTGKKIKIKGNLLSKDLGQVEAMMKEVGRNIIRATDLNNPGRLGVGYLPRQSRKIISVRTTAGQKKVPNPNSKKPRRTIDSPVSRTGLHQYDYLTNSNRLTTPSMMAKPNQGNGSEYIHNQLN